MTYKNDVTKARIALLKLLTPLADAGHLTEAKRLVDILDEVTRLGDLKPAEKLFMGMTDEERATARTLTANGYPSKIDAIRAVRARTAMGLKESKDLVEAYLEKGGGR